MNTELLGSAIQSFGLPDFVVTFFVIHPYEIIFVCLLFGAGVIIFPAFYLAIVGVLKAPYILGIMVLATMVADTFWYLVGRGVIPKFIESRMEKGKYLKKLTTITEGREFIFLFYSKFVYGTRIATQMLCGVRKVNFPLYLTVTAVAVLILGGLYYLAIRLTSAGVDSLGDLKYKLGIVITITMLAIGTLHFIVYRLFGKKFING